MFSATLPLTSQTEKTTKNPRIVSSTSQCVGQGKKGNDAKSSAAGRGRGSQRVSLPFPLPTVGDARVGSPPPYFPIVEVGVKQDCPEHDFASRFNVPVDDVLIVARYLGLEKLKNMRDKEFFSMLEQLRG